MHWNLMGMLCYLWFGTQFDGYKPDVRGFRAVDWISRDSKGCVENASAVARTYRSKGSPFGNKPWWLRNKAENDSRFGPHGCIALHISKQINNADVWWCWGRIRPSSSSDFWMILRVRPYVIFRFAYAWLVFYDIGLYLLMLGLVSIFIYLLLCLPVWYALILLAYKICDPGNIWTSITSNGREKTKRNKGKLVAIENGMRSSFAGMWLRSAMRVSGS